jgi:Fur family ferric uptake transcriptional regulator
MHHARATLRESGYRLTPQRTAVWDALRDSGRHMTADEIAAAVHAALPDINVSTVYRTLELLVSLDLVTETKLGTARSYFEVAPEPVHHHFVCERCGAVGHFGDELFLPIYGVLKATDGFAAKRARATVFGVCGACGSAEAAPGGADRPSSRAENHAHP